MTLDNHTLELLSGYLDNQLNVDELRKVEKLLQDPAVREQLHYLRQNRASLRRLATSFRGALPSDFAQKVLTAALNSTGSQVESTGSQVEVAQPIPSTSDNPVRNKPVMRWWTAFAGLAALLVIALSVFWQKVPVEPFRGISADPNDLAGNQTQTANDQPSENPTVPVRQHHVQLTYVMTMDVELSPGISFDQSIGKLLQEEQVRVLKGTEVSKEISNALDSMRFTDAPDQLGATTEVYLIRLRMSTVDQLFDAIAQDQVTYPAVRLGLAFETPSDLLMDKLSSQPTDSRIQLAQAMADSIGEDDATEPFALPLVDSKQAQSFSSLASQGELLVGASRQSRSSSVALPGDEDEMSFILLFVRRQ